MSNDSENEKPIDPDLLPSIPMYPTVDMEAEHVEASEFGYSIFNRETDFVIGGPLGESTKLAHEKGHYGARRWFESWACAEEWAKGNYGDRLKGRKPSEPGDTRQWAFIVRKHVD